MKTREEMRWRRARAAATTPGDWMQWRMEGRLRRPHTVRALRQMQRDMKADARLSAERQSWRRKPGASAR